MSTKRRLFSAVVFVFPLVVVAGAIFGVRSCSRWGPGSVPDAVKAAKAAHPLPSHPELREPEWDRDGVRRDEVREEIEREYKTPRKAH